MTVGEDLVINRKIKVRRRFLGLLFLFFVHFADSPPGRRTVRQSGFGPDQNQFSRVGFLLLTSGQSEVPVRTVRDPCSVESRTCVLGVLCEDLPTDSPEPSHG
jgi:hypothetical protein